MLLLKKKTFDVESVGTRVAADEAALVARAEAVMAAAEAEAAETRRAAQAAYEAEKARGYADGLDAGKAEILMQKLNLVDESVRYMASIEDKVAEKRQPLIEAVQQREAQVGAGDFQRDAGEARAGADVDQRRAGRNRRARQH